MSCECCCTCDDEPESPGAWRAEHGPWRTELEYAVKEGYAWLVRSLAQKMCGMYDTKTVEDLAIKGLVDWTSVKKQP